MERHEKRILFSLIVSAFLMFLGTGKSQISLSPLYIRLNPEATGQSQTTFTVTNGSSEAVRFRATFSNFAFDGTEVKLINDEDTIDLSPYLRAAPLEFEIPAFSEQIVRVIALVPPSILKHELRSALILDPLLDAKVVQENDSGDITGQILFEYRFLAQIFLSPNGAPEMQVEQVNQGPNNSLQLVVSNQGSTSGVVNVSWQLFKEKEEILSSQTSARFVVLTRGKRTSNLTERLDLEPGEYTLTGTFGTEDGGEPPVVLNPQPFTKTFTVE